MDNQFEEESNQSLEIRCPICYQDYSVEKRNIVICENNHHGCLQCMVKIFVLKSLSPNCPFCNNKLKTQTLWSVSENNEFPAIWGNYKGMVNNRKRVLLQNGLAITLLAEQHMIHFTGALNQEGNRWYLSIVIANIQNKVQIFIEQKELRGGYVKWKKEE